MMTGKLYVDGKDAFATWGVFVVSGGWNELLAYPKLKEVESNDWQEEDGIEADLSNPVLDTKEAAVEFAYSGPYASFVDFIALLADKGYHEFNCTGIGRSYKLRLLQMPNLEAYDALGFVSLKFADDFPLRNYTYLAPQSSIPLYEDYLIDSKAFTSYGCRVLQGSLAEVMKAAQVKTALLRNISTRPGAQYDSDASVTFKSKDVKINCLMRAPTLAELWRNYDALLYDLTRPGARQLEVAALEQSFPCFYKSASITEFFPDDGEIWLTFSLTLTFTGDFRIDGGFALATENSILLYTEDGESAIEIQPTSGSSDRAGAE